MRLKQTSFFAPEKLLQRARVKAIRHRVTMTEVICQGLERFVEEPFEKSIPPEPEVIMTAEEMAKWIEAWNRSIAPNLGVQPISHLGRHRKYLIRSRLKENPKLWEDIYEESQFVGKWAKDHQILRFDFLLEEKHLTKYLDGYYRDSDKILVVGDSQGPSERENELKEEYLRWEAENKSHLTEEEQERKVAEVKRRFEEWRETHGTTDPEKSRPPPEGDLSEQP